MNLENYGFDIKMLNGESGGIPARITACRKNAFEFVSENGRGLARLKAGAYFYGGELIPTTGDFVLLSGCNGGENLIIKTLERKTCFKRVDPSSAGRNYQAVAANFDRVFIMQSMNQNFNTQRLERYLALAWESGASPVIVLTKADLAADIRPYIGKAQSVGFGADVLAVSVKTGYGIQELKEYFRPRETAVFLGSSGVGKSSLVNAVAGRELMAVGDIREKDGRGRHTTTHRQLIMLDSGAMIIDTPGMRELGMWDAAQGLSKSFDDIERYFGKCRFSDCRHQSEPGCAVKEAIERGKISRERWESYLRLKRESSFSEGKGDYQRKKYQRNRKIKLQQRNIKKMGGIIDE